MDRQSTLARVSEIVAALFNVPLEQVTEESSSKSLQRWDSLGHLMLVLELEQQFDVQFTPEQVESMTRVDKIVEVLLSHPAASGL